MGVWQYYQTVTRRLLLWSIISVVVGAALLFLDLLWQGVGLQAVA